MKIRTDRNQSQEVERIRIMFLEEKLQAVPFFNIGTNNYQDAGIRLGYKIGHGTYLGAMTSVTMHYGLSLTVSVERNN